MNIDIVRAWKDAEYRESLSSEELALVPAHPAGEVELAEEDLLSVMGDACNNSACNVTCLLLVTGCVAASACALLSF
jgi:mersacidin/lichenicidin family type 2 lantibiotic